MVPRLRSLGGGARPGASMTPPAAEEGAAALTSGDAAQAAALAPLVLTVVGPVGEDACRSVTDST